MSNLTAVILARGGSKGLPNKNFLNLYGHPLIAWSIMFALVSQKFSRVIVSTDSQVIAGISEHYGAEVPFLRSPVLSSDTATSADAIIDVIHNCNLDPDDFIVLLEPTSPYRVLDDLNKLIDLLEYPHADKIMSVSQAVSHSYRFQYFRGNDIDPRLIPVLPELVFDGSRRQDIKPSFYLDGSFYASRISSFLLTPGFLGETTMSLISDPLSSFEIDCEFDLNLYEAIFKGFGPPPWFSTHTFEYFRC